MKSSDMIPSNSDAEEIKQLHTDIASYIAKLDKKIKKEENSVITLEYKIKRWKNKKALLEVALSCLSGDKLLTELDTAISKHSDLNTKKWKNTKIFVDKVKTLLKKPKLTPSFFLSCFTNHFINSQLPNDIQLYLFSFLPRPADVIAFAITSKTNWMFFQENTVVPFLSSLLNHIALSDYKEAEKQYSEFLLTKKGNSSYHLEVDFPRYQYIGLTPFQICLRNEEYQEAGKMAKYLTLEERQKQFNEIFPNGEFLIDGCQLETAKELLKNVYEAIIADNVITEKDLNKMTDKTSNALTRLRDAVNPEKYKQCQKGLVFDMQIYLETLRLYDTNFFSLRDKRLFWCVRVEELVASCLPTLYLRAHCRGIVYMVNDDNTVDWKKLDGRGCVLGDGSSYFDPNNKLSEQFFVNDVGVRCWRWRYKEERTLSISELMSSNNKNRDRLYAAIFPSKTSVLSNAMK